MALDPVEWYLHWFHKRTKKRWATYEPQLQRVQVGDFGRFDDDLLFHSAPDWKIDSLVGVQCEVSAEDSAGEMAYFEAQQFKIGIGGRAKVPLPIHAPIVVKAGTKIEVEATRDKWCALQLRNATRAQLQNTELIKHKIRDLYLRGDWELDRYLVTERIQCSDGFAILGEGRGSSFSLELSADVTLLPGKELVSGSLSPTYGNSGLGWETYKFSGSTDAQLPTPTFSAPMGISRRLWGRLLRTKRFGVMIEDATGAKYPIGKTPINLEHLSVAERLHQPDVKGVMSEDEILAIPINEFVEEFWDLDNVVLQNDLHRGPDRSGYEGDTVGIASNEPIYSETIDDLLKDHIRSNWISREAPPPMLPAE